MSAGVNSSYRGEGENVEERSTDKKNTSWSEYNFSAGKIG